MTLRVTGLLLNVESAGAGRPLLLLHGFSGSIATCRPHLARFAEHRRTIVLDLIGHGQSAAPADSERYRMEPCVEDLLPEHDTQEVARVDLLGYSMGGRVGLHFAAAAPERVEALVLESTSPGLANAAEWEARAAADEALAVSIERDGFEAFVDRWDLLPLFSSQAALPSAARAHLTVVPRAGHAVHLEEPAAFE